jgi:hypothetical protein
MARRSTRPTLLAALAAALAAALGAAGAVRAQAPPPGKPPIAFEDEEISERERTALEATARMVARWAMVQRVVAAVVAQNAAAEPVERLAAVDREWQAGGGGGLAEGLLSNDCAQALQAAIAANPGFAGAFVTDGQGALVCATQRPERYFHGERDLWRRAFAEGAGAIYVAAPVDDATSDLRLQPISVPVRSAGRTVGVLTVTRLADG